jgi:hypothetical protein
MEQVKWWTNAIIFKTRELKASIQKFGDLFNCSPRSVVEILKKG